MVVAAVSSLLGEDLLSYLRTRQEDIQLRSKYLYRFDDGQVAYDCSLGERFTGPMIPLVIKKIITMWDSLPASERGFKSEFAKKAWADLLAYEEIKAADKANLSDLLERPYEDLVTEEIIDSLPGPKIEDLEPEDVPDKVKSVPMDTESTEPTQMEVEGGSVDPVSTKDEVTEDVEMDDAHAQSAPLKKPRTSADPPATAVKEESGSVDPESFVGLGEDPNAFDNLPKISEEEVQEAMKKQGVWGSSPPMWIPRTWTWQGTSHLLLMLRRPVKSTMSSLPNRRREKRSWRSRIWTSSRPSWRRGTRLLSAPRLPLHWRTRSMDQILASITTVVEQIPSTGSSSNT